MKELYQPRAPGGLYHRGVLLAGRRPTKEAYCDYMGGLCSDFTLWCPVLGGEGLAMPTIPTEEFSINRPQIERLQAELLSDNTAKRLAGMVAPSLGLLEGIIHDGKLPLTQRLHAVELVIKLLEVKREI